MSTLIHVIGVVAGAVGIWGFAESHLPPKVEPTPEQHDKPTVYTTTTRVVAGLDGTRGMSHAGGYILGATHYNNNDSPFATSQTRERLEDGSYVDFKLSWSEGIQSVYTMIDGSNDNVCIGLLSTTWPDGTKFGWTGDWANICGLPSYYSGIVMPNGEYPACMWLGAGDNGQKAPFFVKIKWHDFLSENGEKPSEDEAKAMCGISIKAYNAYLEEIALPADRGVSTSSGNARKRDSPSHMGRSDDSLVVSSLSGQNATALCEQHNSYGPDFISLEEGIYCNMETRDTLPLCSSSITGDCFDVDSTSHIVKDGGHKPSIRARNPTKVIRW